MLDKDIEVVDLGGWNWYRLAGLLAELAGPPSSREGKGPLLVFFRGLKVLKAIDVAAMRPVEIDWRGSARLDLVAESSGYPVVVALEEEAVSRIIGHAQREMDLREDYFAQWRHYLIGLKREWRRTVFSYPPGPRVLPVPPSSAIELYFRRTVPDDSLIVFAVTENSRALASVVLGYRSGSFKLVSSLDAVADEDVEIPDGSIEALARALEEKFGGTARAVAVEKEALKRILSSRFPAGAMLWAHNRFQLKTVNIPVRWKLLWFSAALAAGLLRKREKGA